MTWVSASYVEKPKQDLVRLDACEVIQSPLSDPVDYARAAALAFYAEVLEEAMPDHDPQEAVFRLVLAVLQQTRGNRVWMPVTYFALWITRLLGWMPSLTHCVVDGESFGAGPAWFNLQSDGLVCGRHKTAGSRMLSPDSLALARRIFQSPIAALARRRSGRRAGPRICGGLPFRRWSGIWSGGCTRRRRWPSWAA